MVLNAVLNYSDIHSLKTYSASYCRSSANSHRQGQENSPSKEKRYNIWNNTNLFQTVINIILKKRPIKGMWQFWVFKEGLSVEGHLNKDMIGDGSSTEAGEAACLKVSWQEQGQNIKCPGRDECQWSQGTPLQLNKCGGFHKAPLSWISVVDLTHLPSARWVDPTDLPELVECNGFHRPPLSQISAVDPRDLP